MVASPAGSGRITTCVRRGYCEPGRQGTGEGPIDICESHAISARKSGLGSGGTVPPQAGFNCCSPAGELVTLPPPSSVLPWKQLDGPGKEVSSAKSPLVGLP